MASGKTTVPVENTAGGRCPLANHGLSFWIDLGNKEVLFDTGQGNVLLGSARRLNIRLKRLDAIAISHSHYGQPGGLGHALRNSRATTVCALPPAFEAKYARNLDKSAGDVGTPSLDKQRVRDMAGLIFVEGPADVSQGLRLARLWNEFPGRCAACPIGTVVEVPG